MGDIYQSFGSSPYGQSLHIDLAIFSHYVLHLSTGNSDTAPGVNSGLTRECILPSESVKVDEKARKLLPPLEWKLR
jgi:hypothetical protein